jgi:hypothetical protein
MEFIATSTNSNKIYCKEFALEAGFIRLKSTLELNQVDYRKMQSEKPIVLQYPQGVYQDYKTSLPYINTGYFVNCYTYSVIFGEPSDEITLKDMFVKIELYDKQKHGEDFFKTREVAEKEIIDFVTEKNKEVLSKMSEHVQKTYDEYRYFMCRSKMSFIQRKIYEGLSRGENELKFIRKLKNYSKIDIEPCKVLLNKFFEENKIPYKV